MAYGLNFERDGEPRWTSNNRLVGLKAFPVRAMLRVRQSRPSGREAPRHMQIRKRAEANIDFTVRKPVDAAVVGFRLFFNTART
jgi:hypothetical protein